MTHDLSTVREYFRTNVGEWADDRYETETYRGRGECALGWVSRAGDDLLVLDVGCGGGRQSTAAALIGNRVVSVDFAPEMVARTRDRITGQGLEARHSGLVAEARRLPFDDGTFDVMMVLGVVGYLPELDGFLRQAHRLLRPGGLLVCDVAVPDRSVLFHAASRMVDAPIVALETAVRAVIGRDPVDRADPPGFYRQHFLKYAPETFDRSLTDAGFVVRASAAAGFGDFRILGRHALPWRVQELMTRVLNRLSRRWSWLARHGLIYLTAAQRASP